MTYDPCAHVNGVTKPGYVHHRVLGRLRPRKHHTGGVPKPVAKVIDPGIDAGCRRNVVLSKRSTFPSAIKIASVLSVGGLTGGPTSPPIYVVPPPPTPTVPVTPINPPGNPGHPTPVPEPASLFMLLAGIMILTVVRRFMRAPRV